MLYAFNCGPGAELQTLVTLSTGKAQLACVSSVDHETIMFPGPTVQPIALATVSGTSIDGGLPLDFDYTILGALFAFSFSVVVGLWLFGKSAGSIVNIFKPKN
jgi:hypothetical protein